MKETVEMSVKLDFGLSAGQSKHTERRLVSPTTAGHKFGELRDSRIEWIESGSSLAL
jgi:hypothetical protein